MKSRAQTIMVLILCAAVLLYTVYNYMTGKSDLVVLCTACLIIGFPAINLTRALIESFRDK